MRGALFVLLAMPLAVAQQPPELAIEAGGVMVDGDLAEWQGSPAAVLHARSQAADSKDVLSAVGAATFVARFDCSHLYVAGQIADPHVVVDGPIERSDRIELHFGFGGEAGLGGKQPEDAVLLLRPLAERSWQWAESRSSSQQQASQLGGLRVAARRVADGYTFEAAIPFHHLPALRPGAESLGFNVVVREGDAQHGTASVVRSWADDSKGLGTLRFARPGPLVDVGDSAPLWSSELAADLPFLLVPVAAVLVLVLLLRGWPAVQRRVPWLRPTLLTVGVTLFVVGLFLPSLLLRWRADADAERLREAVAQLGSTLSKLEEGTLASYRGASRDRALMQLLAGEPIARQRYTSYRPLAQLVPSQFGPGVRHYDELPVRPYWLPLSEEQPERFEFDPPLRGSRIHLVIGRPFAPSFTFGVRASGTPRLDLALDYGGGDTRPVTVDLDRPFAEGSSLGRDHWDVCVVPVPLDRDLRALSAAVARGSDYRLVGISLESARPGQIEPVMLGTPSRSGVLTDLRGPYPVDAGIELAPNATAKIVIPPQTESPQRLWFFYRAIYPGVPTAIPGAKVAEIVLHFGNGKPKRTYPLEHQVSVFYELAFRNTRDDPPTESPASIALSWTDESKERHVNLGYPVTDLPTDAPLEAIEFKNVAEYRMNFRSVVFVNEFAAAPQDPPGSPLVRTPNGMLLPPEAVPALRGAEVTIYRGGRLSESTARVEDRAAAMALPRMAAAEPVVSETTLADGGRRRAHFEPLRGDGWDGAVLGVAITDGQWQAATRTANRQGVAMCLASAPFLLVLLSGLLAAVTSLRMRLVTVTSVASLVPLGLLSLVLVRVLEGGHRADVEAALRTTVDSALAQFDGQKQKVQASAQQWLQGLTSLAVTRLEQVKEAQFEATVPDVGAELQKRLVGQLPPEWRGGQLRLEWQPVLGKTRAAPQVFSVGDPLAATGEMPARLEPGVFMQSGQLMIGVRAEQAANGGKFLLTAVRPVDANLLGALAPGRDVLLTDVRGYPLAASSERADAADLLARSARPALMAQRERALNRGVELRRAVVERFAEQGNSFVVGGDVLRDLQDTPRAMLAIVQADQRATLDLAVGRIPVRAFFLLVAGSLIVLSVFLSWLVSGRISRPIERLERGAQALSRGQLETRVQVEDGGQIGRLTRAFNQMAADLQSRLLDLQALNRTMGELVVERDEATAIAVLCRFCGAHTPADAVLVALVDAASQRLVVHGAAVEPRALPITAVPLPAVAGPFVCAVRSGGLGAPWNQLVPGAQSLLAMPIVFGDQARGLVLLGFQRQEPWPVDLELLSTVVGQAAIAFERSQLQRHAVQDPVTGTFTPEYFRRRVVDEVSLAQQRGRTLAMLAVAIGDGDRRPRGLRRLAATLRENLPRQAILCHAGGGQFQIAVPGFVRAEAEACLARVAASWDELVRQLPENEVEEARPVGVVVQFPEEAASTEFLFEALRARFLAVQTPGGSAMESDESLQRAGVTAISPAMRAVYGTLRRVAPTDLPLLFEGETGVGKEVLTNLVHRWSRRAGGPLVKVHCAALSETLLASELFGHEKGAFTGADRRKIGRFEQADGGTLFLDEVGEISLDVQVKLLRVLQAGEVDRVGGNEPVKVDVRVIAATNRDIARMVADGRFREDLYYRLQGMVVKVPPLRERKQELASLVEGFRAEVVAAGHATARAWSTDAMDALFRHDWPGNIRELRNTVFRAMVMCTGDVVQLRDVQAVLRGEAAAPPVRTAAEPGELVVPIPRPTEAAPVAAATSAAPPPPPATAPPPPAADPVAAVPEPVESRLPAKPRSADAPPAQPAVTLPALPPRLEELRLRVQQAGRYSTQDHMAEGGLSHRTALRDLQALVAAGYLERIGSRRGTFYRPRSG